MNLQDILAHAILGIMKSIGFALIQMNVKAIRILVDQENVSTRMEVMNAYVILFFGMSIVNYFHGISYF